VKHAEEIAAQNSSCLPVVILGIGIGVLRLLYDSKVLSFCISLPFIASYFRGGSRDHIKVAPLRRRGRKEETKGRKEETAAVDGAMPMHTYGSCSASRSLDICICSNVAL
jgi:hypothetical protein